MELPRTLALKGQVRNASCEELHQSSRCCSPTPGGVPWPKNLDDAALSFAQELESILRVLLLLKTNCTATESMLNGLRPSTD